ncbi:exodeoxyribonuclease VII large subunit [Labrys okinawensis]|uniref:Exodeoxyribonuclease 7 large subunit n=1 Tax=Labrys okinawensis TaxID=346911 RepID=A0A2S9QDS4_9HYPH|nr:exodeoxyribonuclease VII large subunit [Labrys okinawensis]PRH87503.1 exodeoxyribonuclease VII large subunit [Labrys okinawensis]
MSDISPDSQPSNAPEWSVSELSGALKRTVEDAFGYVRVRGEISGYRGPVASGHAYFALKDEGAKIDAVIWKGNFARLRQRPEEGMEVIAHGRLTTFPGKSSYQIIIDRLEPAGLGALMALLEERRRKLAAEGLFDEGRKRSLPFLPRVIGVVTSPTGAVIRDILHRITDRFPRRVVVWPVRVQGDTSAAEIANAIAGFDALPAGGTIPRPDVLIVARGGGSLEDLWSFNEEIVVRAAAACSIPLISAVGHETDWTLIDHVADRRAPTPTGAAEMAVPVKADLFANLHDLGARLTGHALRMIERRRQDLRNLGRALPSGEALLATPRQKLDLAAGRLVHALTLNTRRHHQRYDALTRRLLTQSPANRLDRSRDRFHAVAERLEASARIALARKREAFAGRAAQLTPLLLSRRSEAGRERLQTLAGRLLQAAATRTSAQRERLDRFAVLLEAYSYQGVLQRGFALVRDEQGRPIRNVAAAQAAASLDLQFADGHFTVGKGTAAPTPSPAKAKPKAGQAGPQPSLFDD